jgi:hypothetical protein
VGGQKKEMGLRQLSLNTGNCEGFLAFLFFSRGESRNEESLMKEMTQKAQNILNQMREKGRKRRVLGRLNDPLRRLSTMDSINRMDQDESSRVGGGDQEMKVLKDIYELQEFENDLWSEGSV